jgi:P-type Ca2+ transporter type 2C
MSRVFALAGGAGGAMAGQTIAYVKGAPDVVLALCARLAEPDGAAALDDDGRAAVRAANNALAEGGLRVLAVAERPGSPVGDVDDVETDLTLLGLVGLQDPPRPEAGPAVAACRAAGIRPVMITGDQPRTARAIGRELGLLGPDDRVVTGADLDRMDDAALRAALPETRAYARVTGEHKLRIVRAWRRRGEVVAMTGDGVNDAPAIKEADIGVAMGITGSDVTKEAGDLVLADDNFATIVAAVEEGRVIADNIRKVLRFLLSCNAAEIGVMTAAVALGLPLPLLAVQILWMNLVTDGLPALALGVEPAERGLMRRRPERPGGPLLRAGAIRDLLIEAALMAGATLAAVWLALWQGQPVEVARTMAFTTLVLAQLWQALNCRSEGISLLRLGLAGNPRLLLAVTLAALLQVAVVYLPLAWPIFRTEPLSLEQLGLCLVLAALVWPAVELRKLVFGLRAREAGVRSGRG